jgi:hypothetical protein
VRDDSSSQRDQGAEVTKTNRLIGLGPYARSNSLDVRLGVVFDARRPTVDYLPHRIDAAPANAWHAVFATVSQDQLRYGADTAFRVDEFSEPRLGYASLYTEWDCVVGIRYEEPKRYHRMMAANDRGGTRWDNLCPSYTAGITNEYVATFWKDQPFDLGMSSDFGNCDLCWKKNEGKLLKTIMEDPTRVIWWSGTEERFGQVFRQDRADYKTLGWSAEQRSRQTDFDFDYLAEDIDCFCGDSPLFYLPAC